MKKKGFTLIELIGVIIILGVITLIAIPTIRTLTADSKDELYEVQINNIKDGLKNWAIDNSKLLPKNEGETITLTLGQLKMGGYIGIELKNPKNNKCFGNDMTLEITRYQKNYIYTVNDTTGTETTSCDDYKKPYIILNGSAITYVEVNEEYIEAGVVAKDTIGNDITSIVTTTISGSGNTIDTTKVGNKYTIAYTITIDGETTSVNRTVIVRDTIAPELAISEDVVLDKYASSFDAMNGISAIDNSNDNVDISVKSNVSFGIPGVYIITYTATDTSGNETIKKRSLSILTEFSNAFMKSDRKCITDINSVCENGAKVTVQVNDQDSYDFYVIKDTGEKLTLIMDKNLGSTVAWVSKEDFNNDSDYAQYGNNTKGPITALNYLNSQTSTWKNINLIEKYTYDNNLNGTTNTYGYQKLTITNGAGVLTSQDGNTITKLEGTSRARLITAEEVEALKNLNSNKNPTYLYTNLSSLNTTEKPHGYWYITSNPSCSDYEQLIISYCGNVNRDCVYDVGAFGIRPVIEIYK